MRKKNFIRTSDKETAEKLRKAGFHEISEASTSSYCFVNDGKINFSSEDAKNIVYTDKLYG